MSSICSALRSLALLVTLAGCAGAASTGALPTEVGPPKTPDLVLVWVGHAETERLDGDTWQRAPSFDYEFTVEQRRFADHWESIKHLKRRHPGYDGSAGPREQTMFFRVELGDVDSEGKLAVSVASTLGGGKGRVDREFRSATLELAADVSAMAPFDTYRIAQQYDYGGGELRETVALDDGNKPWVRNREVATLFAPHRFDKAPTIHP